MSFEMRETIYVHLYVVVCVSSGNIAFKRPPTFENDIEVFFTSLRSERKRLTIFFVFRGIFTVCVLLSFRVHTYPFVPVVQSEGHLYNS